MKEIRDKNNKPLEWGMQKGSFFQILLFYQSSQSIPQALNYSQALSCICETFLPFYIEF